MCGPLTPFNSGEHFLFQQDGRQLMEVDGLVSGDGCALLNSAKHSPTLTHVTEVLAAATKLQQYLAGDLKGITMDPPGLKQLLIDAKIKRVLPFLCGFEFSALVAAECHKLGVGIVRPSGEGFGVELPTTFPRPFAV